MVRQVKETVEVDRGQDREHAEEVPDQVVEKLVLQQDVVRRLVPKPRQTMLDPADQHHRQNQYGDVPPPGESRPAAPAAEGNRAADHHGEAGEFECEKTQVCHVVDRPKPHDLFVELGGIELRPSLPHRRGHRFTCP